MGLGFSAWFPVGKGSDTSRERYEEYFSSIPSIIPNWDTQYRSGEDWFRLTLVPFEEDIYGTWEGGKLLISARTNSAGPGYHAYLVDLIDRLGIKPAKVEDETGYYGNRDFRLLQNEMSKWLSGLSEQLLSMDEDYSDLSVSLAVDWFPGNTGQFANCQLGPFERRFFERAQNDRSAGSEFFVWWDMEQNALFFRNVALNLIWCRNNWLQPETDLEYETVAATLACLDKAYSSDPGLDYPAAEWKELADLSGTGGFDTVYSNMMKEFRLRYGNTPPKLRGYMRGMIRSNVAGWYFTHIGKMHYDVEEDGSPVWWDDRMTIRMTTFTVEPRAGTKSNSEALLRAVTEKEKDCEPLSLRTKEIAACIQHLQIEEDGEPLHMTRLTAALDNRLMIMSFYYADEKDREQAVNVCVSVTSNRS